MTWITHMKSTPHSCGLSPLCTPCGFKWKVLKEWETCVGDSDDGIVTRAIIYLYDTLQKGAKNCVVRCATIATIASNKFNILSVSQQRTLKDCRVFRLQYNVCYNPNLMSIESLCAGLHLHIMPLDGERWTTWMIALVLCDWWKSP